MPIAVRLAFNSHFYFNCRPLNDYDILSNECMNSIVRQITLFSALTMETLGDVHEQFEMGSPHELYSVILEHTVCVCTNESDWL